MYITFILLILTTGLVATEPEIIFEDVFENLHTCSRTHWYLNACIEKSLLTMKPYLIMGVPQLEIPSLEPYHPPTIKMESRDVYLGNMTFERMKVHGLTQFNIKNVSTFHNITKIRLELEFPQIKLEGDQVIEGTYMGEPIENRKYNIIGYYKNVKANITINGKFVFIQEPNDEDYFNVTRVAVRFKVIKNLDITLKKILDSKYVSYKTTRPVNEIWKEFGYRIHFNIETFASSIIWKIANKIYSTFSIETLMPVYV